MKAQRCLLEPHVRESCGDARERRVNCLVCRGEGGVELLAVESQEVLGFAFPEAMLGQLKFDSWVVESGEFVVHGLHDF